MQTTFYIGDDDVLSMPASPVKCRTKLLFKGQKNSRFLIKIYSIMLFPHAFFFQLLSGMFVYIAYFEFWKFFQDTIDTDEGHSEDMSRMMDNLVLSRPGKNVFIFTPNVYSSIGNL